MERYFHTFLGFFFILFFVSPQIGNTVELYDARTLDKATQLYSENLRLVWSADLLAKLTPTDRQAAGNVKLDLPPIGVQGFPFDYHSDPSTREITIPILSVKFFDDLAIAAAWLTRKGCAQDPVSDYAGILRYQGFTLPRGNRFPPPLQALAIPQNALADAVVDDIAQKTLKSAIYFLMAHELGHVRYQHKRYDAISRPDAQTQEMQADDFALNIMREISVPPMGMVLFFMVASRFEPAPGDYPNLRGDETWGQILQKDKTWRQTWTHPLTSQRLLAVSKGIRTNANAFSKGQKDPTLWRPRIIEAADQIEVIANTLDDPKIRESQKYRSETIGLGDLRHACHSK